VNEWPKKVGQDEGEIDPYYHHNYWIGFSIIQLRLSPATATIIIIPLPSAAYTPPKTTAWLATSARLRL